MEELFKSSVVKSIVFSAYDKYGPQPIYKFPEQVSEEDAEDPNCGEGLKLTLRDYMQISIKNLSLLIGDRAKSEDAEVLNLKYFAILPYPDFNLTSLTYFVFIKPKFAQRPIASSFSILVNESKRSFLYNNNNRIKPIIFKFFDKFEAVIEEGYKKQEEIEPLFRDLLSSLIELEEQPLAPVTTQRRMKILFVGLDDSGKTSFLLAVDRKFSKLIGLKPTRGVNVKSIEALGATIFLWDLGGQLGFREKYLNKSQIYLYEADLIFYFIDIRNKLRFDESMEYLQQILSRLREFEQNTPLIYILSKGDSDIIDSEEIQGNIKQITSELSKIPPDKEPEIYITSIFSIFSVLRAFSSGISKLSPNKELINHNLKQFSTEVGAYLTLLLSIDGLVLADYYSKKAIDITDIPQEEIKETEEIRNIFEVTAPQFTTLYKIFSKFRTLEKNEAIFKISDYIILFKKARISDFDIFFLFLMDDEEKTDKINELLPEFLNKTTDLLIRYIS